MKGSKLKTRDYLALDLGATSGRAILGNLDGDRLSLREVHRFPNGPIERNGHLHWDLPRILSEVEIGIAKAFELSPELVGMACDSWGVDHGFQDNDGQPIDLPFSYQDSRTQGILETPPLSGNAERIFQRTAAPSTPISTLSQLVVTKKNNHDLWSQARQFLFTPDWVHHHLTGVSVCERTMASTSQLHSWQNGNWDWDLAEEMGIESSLFPMIGTAGDRIGELKSDLANRLKVNGCPVHLPACHDTASAFAAAPCVNEETVILSSGTWSMLGIRVANPILAGEIFELGGGNYALPGNDWALSRGIMGLWLLDRFKNEEGFESLRELVELAKTAEPLACLIDPENPLFQERDPIANLIRQWAEST
ncbi:MAG: hypothetical protein KC931_21850, partial [Candidatus Omnitrophica bacterium]|nr:hypothetical protein [Candidatus Omnitrophota bacterium]